MKMLNTCFLTVNIVVAIISSSVRAAAPKCSALFSQAAQTSMVDIDHLMQTPLGKRLDTARILQMLYMVNGRVSPDRAFAVTLKPYMGMKPKWMRQYGGEPLLSFSFPHASNAWNFHNRAWFLSIHVRHDQIQDFLMKLAEDNRALQLIERIELEAIVD